MSGYTTTVNYGFRKPIVGADNDLWGGDWNTNADTIDTQLKTVSNTQANYLPLTGGTLTGAVTGTSYIIPSTNWTTSADPDIAWSVRDAAGNLAVSLDTTGLLSLGALYVAGNVTSGGAMTAVSLALAGPITGVTSLTTTSATMGGDIRAPSSGTPDIVGGIEQDATGGIVKGFSADGTMQVVGINAKVGVSVGGVPLTVTPPTVPLDAIDVRAVPYNALGDGQENYGTLTTSGTSLTLTNFTGTLSLSTVNATTALLTVTGVRWSGWAFQPSMAGAPLYLVVGAYTLTATVQRYIDGQNVWLNAATITAQTAVTGSITCPAFDPTTAAGKSIVVDGQGQDTWWGGSNMNVQARDTVTPYGTQSWASTIASVVAPNQITTTAALPFTWANIPSRVLWGTNDANAVSQAATAAFQANKRKIWFSGDGRLYLLLGIMANGAGRNQYAPAIATEPAPLINGVMWCCDNARVYPASGGLQMFPHRAWNPGALATRIADRAVFGKLSFPRCSQLSTINVLIAGDSLANYNPQSQSSAVMHASKFADELVRQNPGKRFAFYNIGIGGSNWASLADTNTTYTDTSGVLRIMTIPRPIVGSIRYVDWFANINQTATAATSPIVPDLIAFFQCGANDSSALDGGAMHALINVARNVTHADGFGPTDILLQTDFQAAVVRSMTDGVAGGTVLPQANYGQWSQEYSTQIIRTTARSRGFGCIDMFPLAAQACFGADPTHRNLRSVPAVTISPTPAVPVSLPYQCRDLTAWLNFPAANDAAAWAAMQQLDITMSVNPGNRLMLRKGANGNIWLGQSAYGYTVATTVTVTAGAKTITLGAATAYPGLTYMSKYYMPQISLTIGTPFVVGMTGQCLIAPSGNLSPSGARQPQRHYIRTVLDTANIMTFEAAFATANIDPLASTTLTIGGQQFIEQDQRANTDIVIFYPDGTIFCTKVATGSYIGPTQVTLQDNAPQSLAAVSVPMFLGRLGVRWYDTGITPSATTNTGILEVNINRASVMVGYMATLTNPIAPMPVIVPIERFGQDCNPVFSVLGAQQIVLNNIWVDSAMPFAASCTPWELRGMNTANSDSTYGGVGVHDGARQRAEVVDLLYATQNLTTG